MTNIDTQETDYSVYSMTYYTLLVYDKWHTNAMLHFRQTNARLISNMLSRSLMKDIVFCVLVLYSLDFKFKVHH
jgi:hypothetical protein